MALHLQRNDGSFDHFYVTPDGSMFHAYENAAHEYEYREQLTGVWSTELSAFWDGSGQLHVRGVGWAGGPLNSQLTGLDGAVFEVVWNGTWADPTLLI